MQSLQTTSSSTMLCEKYESPEITAKNSLTKHSLDFLTKQEISRIDHAIVEFKKPKYLHECNSNILETLQKLPDELTKKVVVVIATHGGNGIITYF
ncbi:hypothetical protein [Salinisphaera sp. G21_0]|uniref:hypothetical protein n=1 Tax=Salinisphaera sp. G21_0 TaxID=2821094 RepID=UPI001AD9BC49|nr:hypothetical protein [Salinisphaera sp. G21_0]MBO9484669.1 hypothetical protein [Salinisphaera sp. G21_0]